MRSVMTNCLINKSTYQRLTNVGDDSEYANFMRHSKDMYEDALRSLPNLEPPAEFQDCPALTADLQHKTFLEELVFWTVKYEFPERLVCLLLKMLPDTMYKDSLTRSFVQHYSRVSMMLMRSYSDKLSSRIVRVSVQLFSNEELALAMTEQLSLLHIMVSSLKNMIKEVLIPCELHDESLNRHRVVDNAKHVLRDHYYWPLVSDLNNVLSHPSIAFKFMENNSLLTMWFNFLKMFQGMNLNRLVLGDHVEFEPNTYYASFTAELEAAAIPMWALVSHLKDESTRPYTANVLKHCLTAIREWWDAIHYTSPDIHDLYKVSFHFPLHRYFSVFLRQAVEYQGFGLTELLPDPRTLSLLMQHPLRCQTAFYEIRCGLWVRNGRQIKGQAMTYIQCNYYKSMVDADIFLLQMCATHLPPEFFFETVLDRFKVKDWLSLSPGPPPLIAGPRVYRDQEQRIQMVESALFFLVSVMSIRTNLGISEEDLVRLEIVSFLCMGDKTHSMLHKHMQEKCGTTVQVELFDRILRQTATYRYVLICSKRSSNNLFCNHATSCNARMFLLIIPYRNVSIATLLTLTTEHRGRWHRPHYK
jgi:E3 ubiquitin-protein ligase UBR3